MAKVAQFIVDPSTGPRNLANVRPGGFEQRVPFDTTTVASPIATLEHPGLAGGGAVVRVHEEGFYIVNAIVWLRLEEPSIPV